jgi:amino acid transporter
LAAVIGSGVIYAYVGFQGPLDFAGNIKRRGIGEAARLRWALFGTLIGSIVLYIALQVVFSRYHAHWNDAMADSPYAQFVLAASMWWLMCLLRFDALVSPMGAGLVFAHALTREVAALSRAHLTHRGLQTARKASLKRRYDVYWLVLVVDFFVGAAALVAVGGKWNTLVAITGVLTLIVYAIPGVALVSLRDHLTGHSRLRRNVHEGLARLSFVLIALILYAAGWAPLWQGMVTLAVGCILLLWLPVLARQLPAFGRFYDAKEHVTLFRHWRTNSAAMAATWLIGHLAVLMLLTRWGNPTAGRDDHKVLVGFLVVTAALVAFEGLVRTSKRHMAEVAPMLPTSATTPPTPAATAANE